MPPEHEFYTHSGDASQYSVCINLHLNLFLNLSIKLNIWIKKITLIYKYWDWQNNHVSLRLYWTSSHLLPSYTCLSDLHVFLYCIFILLWIPPYFFLSTHKLLHAIYIHLFKCTVILILVHWCQFLTWPMCLHSNMFKEEGPLWSASWAISWLIAF